MDKVGYPRVHGEYLATQKDLARLNELLKQTNTRYKEELQDATYLPLRTRLANWLIPLLTIGLVRPADRRVEIKDKKRKIHETFCKLIDEINKEISQLTMDVQEVAKFQRQFTISIEYGRRHDGYPSNWEEISRAVRERDEYRCTYCSESSLILHVHHVIPLSRGGSNAMSNLVTLCEKHHTAKHPHMRR